MKIPKHIFKSGIFKYSAVILLLSLIIVVGLIEPRSSVGHVVFHIGYTFKPTRPVFLKFYQWSLWKYEGGYLPSDIDEFLIDRLSFCQGTAEETAILDFQIHQGSGRWGDAASRSHDIWKGLMIANIVSRIDEMTDKDAISAMVFIESLRRDNSLCKGGFNNMWDYDDGIHKLKVDAFEIAKKSFKIWWEDGSDWPSIKKNDPLAYTNLEIYEGP